MRRILLAVCAFSLLGLPLALSAANFVTYPYAACTSGAMSDYSGFGICTGPASSYNITLEQITLIKSDDTTVDVLTDSWTEDLASVPSNSPVGDIAQDVSLAVGSYKGIIISLNRTISGTAAGFSTTDSYSCSGAFNSDLNFDGTPFTSLPVCGTGEPNTTITDCRSGNTAKYYYDIDLNYTGGPLTYEITINADRAARCQFGGDTTGVPQLGIIDISVDGQQL